MPTPSRRARFQIHLSTAIVLMFVAGLLIWANVIPRTEPPNKLSVPGKPAIEVIFIRYGFPIAGSREIKNDVTLTPRDRRDHPDLWTGNSDGGWFVNLVFACMVLYVVGLACEKIIRQRAARKGA